MSIIAYLRVSKDSQDTNNQKLAILDYAHAHKMEIGQFMEISVSSRRSATERKIDALLSQLQAGDTLIVAELSRLGRSVGEIITGVDALIKKKTRFIAIKEKIDLSGSHDLQSKVMITLFGLFADIERDLISLRTKEGLAAARAKGKLLGRPKGKLGYSKLDGKEEEIKKLLSLKVSKASIAKITGCTPATLHHFIKTRKLAGK